MEVLTEGGIFCLDEDRTGLSRIIELIESAHNTLEAADYSIRHTFLADALLAAHRRSGYVRVVTDHVQSKDKGSSVKMMKRLDFKFRMDKA